jgi:polyisoprenoid-binding protein YceI
MSINSTAKRPAIAAGTYTIEPSRTTVRFESKVLWGVMTVRGTFAVIDGDIVVAEDPARSSVRVAMDPASFASGNNRCDRDITGMNYLDVASYPTMSFANTQLAHTASGWTMRGLLTVHGVTSPMTVQLIAGHQTESGCTFAAAAVVDRTAFGVSKLAGFIARELTVIIEIVATSAN